MNELKWHEELGDDGLKIWSAASIYHDDGDAFMFRIKERETRSGAFFSISYDEASDAELMPGDARSWVSLQSAKDAMQSEHLAMIAAESAA